MQVVKRRFLKKELYTHGQTQEISGRREYNSSFLCRCVGLINGSYFFFEDVDTDGRTVKARICLNIVTLENWMRIIKCECDTAKQLRDDMKKNRGK